MTLKDAICEALTKYAREGEYISDEEVVVDFEEVTNYGGFCDTCWYEATELRLTFASGGTTSMSTTLSDLVRSF